MAMNIDVNPDEKNYRKVESEMNPIIVVITYALIYWVFRLFRCEGKLYFYIFSPSDFSNIRHFWNNL